MTEPILIEDYDPRWPECFELLRSRLASALGSLAAAIEHIGSTAVPALAAKPVLDIDILLSSDSARAPAITKLGALGYAHRGDLGVSGREAFRAPAGDFPHHLYVCPPDSTEYQRHIAFRDYLRRHRDDANAYAELKRSLAARFRDDREEYTRAKAEFVEQILAKSELCAREHFAASNRIVS
jgi:GrpB-like predicted nucleotidyltransferase (UPF0157 family)